MLDWLSRKLAPCLTIMEDSHEQILIRITQLLLHVIEVLPVLITQAGNDHLVKPRGYHCRGSLVWDTKDLEDTFDPPS